MLLQVQRLPVRTWCVVWSAVMLQKPVHFGKGLLFRFLLVHAETLCILKVMFRNVTCVHCVLRSCLLLYTAGVRAISYLSEHDLLAL